jgi:hypothetical protein
MNTLSVVALTVFATLLLLTVVALSVAVVYLLKKQLQRNEFKKRVEYASYGSLITTYFTILVDSILSDRAVKRAYEQGEETAFRKAMDDLHNDLNK